MKRLFLALAIVFPLISCLNGTIEAKMLMPEIRSFRILGYDSSGGYVEKYTFQSSRDWPYLEFTVYDDGLDINVINITLYNDTYPDGKRDFVYELYQYVNPQTYMYPIPVSQSGTPDQNNLWYLQFFVTDKNGKRSKTHTSSTFTVLPY
jgi:hypothetical protein